MQAFEITDLITRQNQSGQDYRELPAQELRRRIGMVMQSAYLFPGTVATNLGFGPQHACPAQRSRPWRPS